MEENVAALKTRYRDPYNAQHSSVSRNLMSGKNPLWFSEQLGHSVQTMLEVYAAWTEGAGYGIHTGTVLQLVARCVIA